MLYPTFNHRNLVRTKHSSTCTNYRFNMDHLITHNIIIIMDMWAVSWMTALLAYRLQVLGYGRSCPVINRHDLIVNLSFYSH